ncbi:MULTISPECIES: FAD-dependent oxidoreductase [unclassified Gordonia (in: high G+C Gram-positive bacteria)]|uniref:FAD-dependent oxidoreductase n=1 Tax=unclassified Gordonia (in: high G+C Gram-positive bacteria) TaxID=2657482 RepID=UPI0007EC207D|nr:MULTISPECIES: FAD-binding protein [unclassified Gordonia (in: high G+C Gram-positive bacteria)]OBC06536.1 pyridine nucleotide-disulfide oxidoreductase [Gordonia sp. 852002-50395_SCH5434458]OBC11702.1 pyridine nucleotide-disulfide oxidoreductase [Gordonia sp. 852002-50816_SCH5313054-a]OBC16717.1 pyridine nucleotide-disulfide oxidoreductase [Gordonia sp. 852002-50816_SCH5313054-c]
MTEQLTLQTDVLVLGGGPAAAWAALNARDRGAEVVLVDKGYCGTSGTTAPAGTGVWYVVPDPERRAKAKADREQLGGYLADHNWMDRVLDQTYANMRRLGDEGRYPYPIDEKTGEPIRTGLQGPEYMRRMRAWLQRRGVRILDHSPALELLVDDAGRVSGAAGVQRQTGDEYRISAGAVVLATGGCAFLSRALGTNVDTGDGALMAAEVGAEFSGMEFGNAYGIVPKGSTITKTAYYGYASFYHEDGRIVEGAGSMRGRSVIARTLLTEKVFAQLDRADETTAAQMRLGQPNFFLQFDRRGIDPFTQRFEVDLLAEGTVRGTGGVNVIDDDCWTGVEGLYAAGDAATRERICGGFTGGGSHNAAWAMSSGTFAGAGAARDALAHGRRAVVSLRGAGRVGLGVGDTMLNPDAVVVSAQSQLLPFEKNYLRDGSRLTPALGELNSIWEALSHSDFGASTARGRVLTRQAAAITAVGRWIYTSALARTESRGMSSRDDYPALDPAQHGHILIKGLDDVEIRCTPALPGSLRPHQVRVA